MSRARAVDPLVGNQMLAVEPGDSVWLSASAGTGKTHVLSSRVLRLLLRPGVSPSQILCLTFTKAGATEMAKRVNEELAKWVRLPETELAPRLDAIGAPTDQPARDRARTLFAAVLDCPGGGLRIDTIHAFAQWLLGAFPHEAGLIPGSRAMEDRDRALLARQVLADLLIAAENDPLIDPQLTAALADLSLRMGPEDVEAWLLRCAASHGLWFGPGSWQAGDMRGHVLRLLGLPEDADVAGLAALCSDASFDTLSLRRCLSVLADWNSGTGRDGAAAISAWLALDPASRAEQIDVLRLALFTKGDGVPKQLANLVKRDPSYEEYIVRVADSIARVRDLRKLLELAERLVSALRLARAFAHAWEEAKTREGLIDFDDQIRMAAQLLGQSALADWIRYKLDRRFDHVLVDEAQDTNAAQWDIVFALTDEFWAGLGQRDHVMRTLFVVGDYKQAIFRFQGTSPENFEASKQRVRGEIDAAAANARALRSNLLVRELQDLGLGQSFRTAQPVLDFVDRALTHIGSENLGLHEAAQKHDGLDLPGTVALWRPVGEKAEGTGDSAEDSDEGEEGWLNRSDRQMADRIARQVKDWLDRGLALHKGGTRRAGPGDIMVLVRKRRELAGLIVARLHAAGVPVAGVDRLRLGAPLAVQDLVAALRFAAQPLDDLNLAALMVTPLIGWSQEQLLEHGWREKEVPLWDHLRRSREGEVMAAMEQLQDLLRRADFDPPQVLLHWLLVGPWQSRARLIARLGHEAGDPIDELVNAAYAYAASATPSLVGFLAWFDAGDGELKREAGAGGDVVRVMTAHGAKGLQAPIVILADATGNPERSKGGWLELTDPLDEKRRKLPIPALRSEDRVGRLAEEHARAKAEDLREHWRLLYVAMTRAEEALFIGGALSAREKEPHDLSWYAQLRALFPGEAWVKDPVWGDRLDWGDAPAFLPAEPDVSGELPLPPVAPPWLHRPAAAEPRPPRPLAPSSLGEDDTPDPPLPPGPGAAVAARRGVLLHRLLERLPELPVADRLDAGARWLARNAPELGEAAREAMLASALGVIAHPDWSDLFASGALAEVPIAATVGERVVAGTIDRLLIGPDRIRLVDFKTARRPPERVEDVPLGLIRQMAAYALALEAAYPGRSVEAALLYTAAPRLIALSADLLAPHKRGLLVAE